jgi:hypothetical protein
MKYRYIGGGDNPPKQILFMGCVRFMLGEAVEVTDELALSKLSSNQCFEPVNNTPVMGSLSSSQALSNQLQAAGAKVDGRWGLPRLKQEVSNLVSNQT